MSAASGLYQQLVLDHQRAPRNYGALADATHHADGANALCGDHLHMQARCAEGRIQSIAFTAQACAITMAAASMLSQRAAGFDATQLEQFETEFCDFLRGESSLDPRLFGDLAALGELQHYPARRRCALLPFATLRAALAGATFATTEKDTP